MVEERRLFLSSVHTLLQRKHVELDKAALVIAGKIDHKSYKEMGSVGGHWYVEDSSGKVTCQTSPGTC